MEVEFDLRGLTNIVDKVSSIKHTTMNLIGQTIKSDILLNYIEEKEPNGTPWADLKPATIREKRKIGKEKKLIRTGNLKKSLNFRAKTGEVKIGYGMSYSVFHQLGTKNMVARKILPTEVSEIDMEEIERLIIKGINDV